MSLTLDRVARSIRASIEQAPADVRAVTRRHLEQKGWPRDYKGPLLEHLLRGSVVALFGCVAASAQATDTTTRTAVR
jgi:hypothetical protein